MKNKTMRIIITLCIISLSTLLYSQENERPVFHNYAGLSASSISGAGLSYGYLFGTDYMLKINGFYYQFNDEKTSETDSDEKAFNKTKWWSAGGELQRNFYQIGKGATVLEVYGFAGGSYWYHKKERPLEPEYNTLRKHYAGGLGVGLRFIFAYRFSINASVGYQYSDWIDSEKKYVGLGGGCGANFLF